jgi:ABC-type sugar transport system ATPase subunit
MDGSRLLLMIRPEHVQISPSGMAESINSWSARVQSVTFLGNLTESVLNLNGHEIAAQMPGIAALTVGQDVFLRLPPEKCAIVRDQDHAAGTALSHRKGSAPLATV